MTRNEKIFSWMLNPLVLIAYLLLLALSYVYFDKALAYYFYPFDLRVTMPWLNIVSLLGKSSLVLTVLLLSALYFEFFRKDSPWRNRLWFLFLCVFLTNSVGLFLKITLGRARPELLFDSQLYGFYWFKLKGLYWSFPSGHTTTVVAVLTGLTLIFPRYLGLFFLVGLMIISTRILLYHHYLSDVLAGFYLTVLEVGLIRWLLNKNKLFMLE